MRRLFPLSVVIGLAIAPALPAAQASAVHGKQVFDLWCYSCHKRLDPGDKPVAGTSSLQRDYQGTKPAALEDRRDLPPAYVRLLVRRGYKSMPATRKTEVSDADLDDLVAYLTQH